MTMPSSRLPSEIIVDPTSQWHVSALLSTALETMTLPSRLKARGGSRGTIDQLVNATNVNGNQNVAKIRMSVNQRAVVNGHNRLGRLGVRDQSRDLRVPSRDRNGDDLEPAEEDNVSIFDIDFFPAGTEEQSRGRRNLRKPHVFGQIESHRSEDPKETPVNDEDEGYERARRRAAGLPIIQKSVHRIPCVARLPARNDSVSFLVASRILLRYFGASCTLVSYFHLWLLTRYQPQD